MLRPLAGCCWGEPTSPPMHDGVVGKLAGPDLLKPEPPTVAQPVLTPQADHKETSQVLDPHLEHCVAHYSREAFDPLIGPCWL